jgi:UTP--glucose-1-phosphate uridylyltransferase
MLPLVDKPGIQWVVEEAVRAGITDILIVTGRSKKTVEDHFDRSPELEATLERGGKGDALRAMIAITEMADIHFVRQHEARGLGHAVGMGRHHVGDEPFAVLLPDDLMAEDSTLLADMVAACERTESPVIALKRFGPDQISLYGAVATDGVDRGDGLVRIVDMVEKPKAEDAPSDLAIMGRYVLTPDIFDRIGELQPGAGGELQLTDAMRELCKERDFYGLPFTSGRFDTGNKLDWLRATVEVALQHPEVGAEFREALTEIVRREQIS